MYDLPGDKLLRITYSSVRKSPRSKTKKVKNKYKYKHKNTSEEKQK